MTFNSTIKKNVNYNVCRILSVSSEPIVVVFIINENEKLSKVRHKLDVIWLESKSSTFAAGHSTDTHLLF